MADPVLSTIGASDSTHLAKGIDQRRLNALEHRMPGVNLHVPRKRVKELRLRSYTAASAQPVDGDGCLVEFHRRKVAAMLQVARQLLGPELWAVLQRAEPGILTIR